MALGTPVVGATAYSAQNGTSVSPAYPAGILATDVVLLFTGQKPSTANGGTATTPAGWTLREELLAAGGYGTTLGADVGNTNLRVYSWDTPVAGQTGTRAVTLATNNISWAFIVRIPTGGGALSYGSADGQQTATPGTSMSIALTNGATATNFEAGDKAIWAMCIPTDVTTPSQFSAQSITATGATFATATELNEPDSATGNDIGGYSAYAHVNSGSSTTAPTVVVTVAGTRTNVRGPVVLLRVREAPATQDLTPNRYDNAQTFFSPHVSFEQFLTPALYTNGQTFFSPDVTQTGGGANLDPDLYTNAQTFFAPTVTTTRQLLPSLYSNTQTFFAATVTATRTLTPNLYTNGQTFFAATVVQAGGPQTLTPSLYTNAQTFYAPAVTRGAVTLLPSLYSNAQVFYSPTVTATKALTPALFTNAQTFYSATVSQGSTTQALECLAYVDTGYVEPDWYVAWSAFNTQTFFPATATQFAQRGEGWGGILHKGRPRSFRRERTERENLRAAIEQAIDPIVATEAKVVTVGNKVAVITERGPSAAIPVPPAFDAKAVSVMVAAMLEKSGIEAQRVRSAEARRQAEAIFEQIRYENEKRRIKKRREEELLLLA